MSEVNVLVVSLSDDHLVLKSKDGVTPLFKNELSKNGFKQFLESEEGERYKVTLVSDQSLMLEKSGAADDFHNVPASVRMPHEAAVTQGIFTHEEMFLFWNMHEIGNHWSIEWI
ncbi:MAG: hypothetical protein J6N72_02285 [Psychrobacter sp.]|nr:hypothetical protein [Psychrobacter sp.]